MAITFVESSKLPTPWGMFEMHGFSDSDTDKEHVVLTMGAGSIGNVPGQLA